MTAVATLEGMLHNFLSINPIDRAVINGFLPPPLMVLIMPCNHKDVMGERTDGVWMNVLGWTATIAMIAAAIDLVVTWGKS